MSFSTQQEFFSVSFPNEEPKPPTRKRSDGAIMTYDFCTDGRAWALDKAKRSNYILDIVHKTRFKRALAHPEGEFELSKDYLVNLDVDDLAEYALSLQAEIKRKNEKVKKLEGKQKVLQDRNTPEEQKLIQQQSAELQRERQEFDQQIADLEEDIIQWRDRAERYDLLAKENELLRQQLQKQRIEAADKMRLINAEAEASFNRMRAEECERLEAELILYRTQYDDLRAQKRDLKEQLQRAATRQNKVGELKRQLAVERAHREQVEEEMEQLMELFDKQTQEVQRRGSLPVATEQRDKRSSIQEARKPVEDIAVESAPTIQKPTAQDESPIVKEQVVESCSNCPKLQAELDNAKESLRSNQEQAEREKQSLKEQLESAIKQVEEVRSTPPPATILPPAGSNKADGQLAELAAQLQQCQADLKASQDSEKSLREQITSLQKDSAQLESKLADETKKSEQLAAEATNASMLTADLQASLQAKDAALSASGGAGAQLVELQKQLDEAKRTLREKADQLDVVSKEKEQLGAKVDGLEVAQKAKDKQLEAARVEQKGQPVVTAPMDTAELDALKKSNEELKKEVANLKDRLVAAEGLSKELQEGAGDQAELLKTVANLKAEVQKAAEEAQAKDAEMKFLEKDVESAKVQAEAKEVEMKQLEKEIESVKAQAEAKEAEIKQLEQVVEAVKVEAEKAKEVSVEKLKEVVEPVAAVERVEEQQLEIVEVAEEIAVVEKSASTVAVEGVEEAGPTAAVAEEPIETPVVAEELEAISAAIFDEGTESAAKAAEVTEQRQASAIEDLQRRLSRSQEHIAVLRQLEEAEGEPGDEIVADVENVGERDVAPEEDSRQPAVLEELDEGSTRLSVVMDEEAGGEGPGRTPSVVGDPLLDICIVGESDFDKTKRIAIKIVRHGIKILTWSELDYLHHEICKAMIERFRSLGQNVQAIDKAIGTCNEILAAVNAMHNSEMAGMISSAAQVPIRNPTLLEDEIPVRLAPEVPRISIKPKRTGSEAQVFAMFTEGLPANRAKPRVLVDYKSCMTRSWGPPKTPTETIISTTLADGSRLYARQKRH
ncbi:flagellar attachment zone protein 1 [Culex quinquefasciatus]|uniref:flagellar attachment zone protein 1 n=1 Tax=Culex quinquefasciatus TaxID=7176 RepID=UPI0018E324FE|nr:flagellar attachment zone protein 1 [Culex quinquefasciatus]